MAIDFFGIDIYMLGGILYSSLAAFILFFRNKKNAGANRLLALGLLGIAWYCVIILTSRYGVIRRFPLIYGYGVPVYYLVPVFFFLYVRRLTNPEQRWLISDGWHFLPSLISLIALIPFYLSPLAAKQALVDTAVSDLGKSIWLKFGWICNAWHLMFRPVHGLFYVGMQWALLWRQSRTLSPGLRKWLFSFTLLETSIYVCLAVMTVIGFQHTALGWQLMTTVIRWPVVVSVLLYLGIGIALFLQPEILYGIIRWLPEAPKKQPYSGGLTGTNGEGKVTESDTVQKEMLLNGEEITRCALQLEEVLRTKELYRRQKLTLHSLAAEVGLSPRIVSHVLNQYYKQRFTEYINKYRVEYIISRMKNNTWKELTLEGLAKEAGFSSKSTFFAVFKKYTSVSPAEYLGKLEEEKVADGPER